MDIITFDLDETLINAKKCHWYAFNDAFKKFGLSKITYKKLRPHLSGKHAHQIVKELFPKVSKEKINKIVKEHHRLIGVRYGKYARRIKGVIPALKKIKKKYKIGLISNCTHKEINGLLKGAKIDKKIFDIIIGQDDVRKSKPYPDELFKAERLTHRDIKFHVGDSSYDIIAARRSNTKAISVLTGVHSRKTLKKEKPFAIVKSVADVPRVIL